MKKFLLLLTMMAMALTMNAQSPFQVVSKAAPVPMREQVRDNTFLSWAYYIDNGLVSTSSISSVILVQCFTPSDLAAYNGYQLSRIDFYVESDDTYSLSGTYTIKVYKGGSYASLNPGSAIYSQVVTNVVDGGLTQVTLNSPITIDATQELWFGVEVTGITANNYLMGFDQTSTYTGKGSIFYDGDSGTWSDIYNQGLEVSAWDIEAYAIDPNSDEEVIIDLGLWYIDDGTNQNSITELTVPYGSDFAPVPVVWNYNYAEATNNFYDTLHFEMTFDGTDIGNTGTTATSINTGAGIFWNNFTVFDASDIAYYDLYGTHTFCMTVSTGPGWYENDPSDNTGCLTVTFEGPTATNDHTITVLNTDGSVTPNGSVTVSDGGSQMFSINVPQCSYIQDVQVDGASVMSSVTDNTYTFTNVTADHTFNVIYASVTYTLNTNTDGHGTISPDHETVNCGDSRTFTITPDAGYEINYVTDNTVDVTANLVNNTLTLTNIQLNHSIYVAFTQSSTPGETYTVTASSDGHATVTPTSTTVNAGGNVTINITVDAGYEINYVTDNTVDVTASVTNGSYTLSNINANHTIYVACQVSDDPNVDPDDPDDPNVDPDDPDDPNVDPDDPDDPNVDPDDPDNPDAIQTYASAGINVFPNPAVDVLNIESLNNIDRLIIYDNMGRIIVNQEVNAAHTQLGISNFATGIYVARIFTSDQMSTVKFIKQ